MFSPSIHVDPAYLLIIEYQTSIMKVKETEKEKLYFDYYDVHDLNKLIQTQHAVILNMRKKHMNNYLVC
jgi:hypothetical protein